LRVERFMGGSSLFLFYKFIYTNPLFPFL